jgi:hypothetical protein
VRGIGDTPSRNGAAMPRWRNWRLNRSRWPSRHRATVAMCIPLPSLKRNCRKPAPSPKSSPSAEGHRATSRLSLPAPRCSLHPNRDDVRCVPGTSISADGWEGVLKPIVARYQSKVSSLYFRADASFANPEQTVWKQFRLSGDKSRKLLSAMFEHSGAGCARKGVPRESERRAGRPARASTGASQLKSWIEVF